MSTSADLAAFACALADAARAVTLPAAAEAQLPENKATDGRFDPVTAADRGAEQAMRALIEADYPEHGIDGEEYGARPLALEPRPDRRHPRLHLLVAELDDPDRPA
jgi:myo-inositol-1(or 4)-monophosphatase